MKPKNEFTALAICKNPFFILLSFANFFAEWGLFVPLTYLPDAAVVKGNISMGDANYLMSAFVKIFIKSKFGLGVVHKLRLQDKVGRWSKNVHFLSMFIS